MNVPSFENHHGFLEKETEAFPLLAVSYRWRFRFPNNYGASVISGYGAYADKEHPFELAVLHFDKRYPNGKYNLSFSTPITNDVISAQTEDDILATLDRIAAL